jgi:uncharacterized membrane protein (DUF441 family)
VQYKSRVLSGFSCLLIQVFRLAHLFVSVGHINLWLPNIFATLAKLAPLADGSVDTLEWRLDFRAFTLFAALVYSS